PSLPPPSSTLFPYTTLFRSLGEVSGRVVLHLVMQEDLRYLDQGGRVLGIEIDDALPRCPRFDLGLIECELRGAGILPAVRGGARDRKSTRLNSSHLGISYAV